MTIAGNAEVQLGQLAVEHAASEDVKSFAQTMVKAHAQGNEELKRLASELNVQVPAPLDAEHKALVDTLSKLQGAEFDREFMSAMVRGHQRVADALHARVGPEQTTRALPSTLPADPAGLQAASAPRETVSTDVGSDTKPIGTSGSTDESPALTQWAAKTLPAVEQHLQRAQQIQMNLK
jgi:predicted outer membrane protein